MRTCTRHSDGKGQRNPCCGARKAPFELGFQRNTMYCPPGIGGERELQAEEMAGKQSLEGMKQIGLDPKQLKYYLSNGKR